MEAKKYTLKDLLKISEKTGVPLVTLQREYGVYEYTFSSCEEAVKGYTGGYKSHIFFGKKDGYTDPDVIAYQKAWEEISLKEVPDVTKLNFEESLAFIQVCYREGKQLVALVETLEKNIGVDMEKASRFFTEGYTMTFYEHNLCPIRAFHDRLIKKIDLYYQEKIKSTHDKDLLVSLHTEAVGYKFQDVRPYPGFFAILGTKIVRTAHTLQELDAIEIGPKVFRWLELYPKFSVAEILPRLEEYLSTVNQSDIRNCRKMYNSVWDILDNLFSRADSTSELRSLLDIGRRFFSSEGDHDPVFSMLYTPAIERIIAVEFAKNGKLGNFSVLIDQLPSCSYFRKKLDELWKRKTLQALKKPIPNFPRLYHQSHPSLRSEVIVMWNMWGEKEVEGLETWQQLVDFDLGLILIPRRRNEEKHIWTSEKKSFYIFSKFLKKLINVVSSKEDKIKTLNYICSKTHIAWESQAFDVLEEEIGLILVKLFEEDFDAAGLKNIYECVKKTNPYKKTPNIEMVIDHIFKKDPAVFEDIFLKIDPSHQLYSKCLRLKIESTTVV